MNDTNDDKTKVVNTSLNDIGPVSNVEAFARAKHVRRYVHRATIVFQDRCGGWFCMYYCRNAIKRAMLAIGTRGHMYVDGQGHPARVGWSEACVRLRTVSDS